MAKIIWDKAGERTFETGLDRGMLYSPHEMVVPSLVDTDTSLFDDDLAPKGYPWNGLTSVDADTEDSAVNPVYFDGEKVYDDVVSGTFSGSIKAITYPEILLEYDGYIEYGFGTGAFIDNQPRDSFGISYRTLLGNDLEGTSLGYKIHLLYNITAHPSTKTNDTVNDNINLTEFEWDITGKPMTVPGFKPSVHYVIDSRKLLPDTLADIELLLYGSDTHDASLPHPHNILAYIYLHS